MQAVYMDSGTQRCAMRHLDMVSLKRVYDPAHPADGYRVLIDRLWPRGLTRDALILDEWTKAVAPSAELRRWFGHETEKWPEFQARFLAELQSAEAGAAIARLRETASRGHVTLLTATRNMAENHAVVLKRLIEA